MNPWNTIMEIDFDENHKKTIQEYCKLLFSTRSQNRTKFVKENKLESSARDYLKEEYNSGFGLKVLARSLGLTYSKIRTLFKHCDIEIRRGHNVITEKLREFRSQRVKGKKNPFYAWTDNKKYSHLGRVRGKQGYYNGVWLRSSWEFTYAKYLDKKNIKWKYEEQLFKFKDNTTYKPDFFIYKNGQLDRIVEVKCLRQPGTRIEKVKKFWKEYPKIKLELITNIKPYEEVLWES